MKSFASLFMLTELKPVSDKDFAGFKQKTASSGSKNPS
jgi:hypothetical protein